MHEEWVTAPVRGSIVLLAAPVVKDELSKIPDARGIKQASVISAKPGNLKLVEDAMIGATAFSDADILVTDGADLGNRFKALNTQVQVNVVDRI